MRTAHIYAKVVCGCGRLFYADSEGRKMCSHCEAFEKLMYEINHPRGWESRPAIALQQQSIKLACYGLVLIIASVWILVEMVR